MPGHDEVEKAIKAPRSHSRRWAGSIAIFICHGEEANGYFFAQCLSVGKNTGVHGLTLLPC